MNTYLFLLAIAGTGIVCLIFGNIIGEKSAKDHFLFHKNSHDIPFIRRECFDENCIFEEAYYIKKWKYHEEWINVHKQIIEEYEKFLQKKAKSPVKKKIK